MKRSALIAQYILIAALACKVLSEVWYSVTFAFPYESFEISDWLINYEGGFVRRGIIGQLLLSAYTLVPFDVKTAIIAFDMVWFGLFVGLMVYVCRSRKWSLLPVVFALALISGGIPRYRRDYMMMLAIYGIYALYMRYLQHKRIGVLALVQLLVSVLIVIYEPVFFLLVPLMGVAYFCVHSEGSILRRLYCTAMAFGLPILTMAFVCTWKGDAGQAETIWASWNELFVRYPQVSGYPPVGAGVDFLGHDMWETFRFHADILFCINRWPEWTALSAAFLLILCYPLVYMFISRVPETNPADGTLCPNGQRAELSSVFLIQLVAMSPMLTVLSCDLERSIPYIVYTTYMFVQLAHTHGISVPQPDWLRKISETIQARMDQCWWLRSFGGYVSLYLCFLLILFAWMVAAKGNLILT